VTRVVLVDDQDLIRTGLARILSPDDGFEVVAEFADGAEAVASPLDADVVMMDIRMPRLDGIAATREITAREGAPAVLILTTFDEDELLWSAIEAGAAGFMLKDASAAELIAATRAVAGGGAWFHPKVAPRVLETYRKVVVPSRRQSQRVDELTEREHEVLVLMARGATNTEIGEQLFVSEATVKTYVGRIFMKLGARDRAAAIVFAYDHGIVIPGVDAR
jgi:DNA-binding NarL/FixJ family response regulator